MIPHITSPTGGFETRLFLSNQQKTLEFYELVAYDRDGNSTAISSGDLEPGTTIFRSIPELFGTADVALTIIDFTGIEVTAVYQAMGNARALAYSVETNTQATKWQIYAGNPTVTWGWPRHGKPGGGSCPDQTSSL